MTKRSDDWDKFAGLVHEHINNYTVAQYGDAGDDIATEYTPEQCLAQVRKYLARRGKNARPGQDELDLLKMAHYVQMAFSAQSV